MNFDNIKQAMLIVFEQLQNDDKSLISLNKQMVLKVMMNYEKDLQWQSLDCKNWVNIIQLKTLLEKTKG